MLWTRGWQTFSVTVIQLRLLWENCLRQTLSKWTSMTVRQQNFLRKDWQVGDLPGGPVVKTQSSQCRGTGSVPDWGAKMPTCCERCRQKSLKKTGRLEFLWPFHTWVSSPDGEVMVFLEATKWLNTSEGAPSLVLLTASQDPLSCWPSA